MLVNDSTSQMSDNERDYFAQEPEFTQVIRVDKEQLKSANHDDIKLRNIRSSEFEEDHPDPEQSKRRNHHNSRQCSFRDAGRWGRRFDWLNPFARTGHFACVAVTVRCRYYLYQSCFQ